MRCHVCGEESATGHACHVPPATGTAVPLHGHIDWSPDFLTERPSSRAIGVALEDAVEKGDLFEVRVGIGATPPPVDTVARECAEQAKRVHLEHGPFASAHETYGVLAEELAEFFDEVRKKREERSPARMRAELIDIAAAAIRAAAELEEP